MLFGCANLTTSKFTIHHNTKKMTTETAAQEVTQCDEQAHVVAEIFANMITDANELMKKQQEAMNRMIHDAMLNVCASTGLAYETIMPMAKSKAIAIDAHGHTDDTEGGRQD